MEDYEYYDLILDYLLVKHHLMAHQVKHNVAGFADIDEDRINLWFKQMHDIEPDYIGLRRAYGTNVLALTEYTSVFKKDGGFKEVVERQRRKKQSVKINFQRADGSNPLADLHPAVQRSSAEAFADGHLREAVLNGFIALDEEVGRLSGLDKFGADLMQLVFSPKNPIVEMSSVSAEQQGFMYLYAGAMLALRNPRAHKLQEQPDPQQAFEWLSYASALFRLLDSAVTLK